MSTRTLTFSGADLRTKALAVDDDKLVVDATTGKVGVGTTEPTESLDIVGNLNLQKVSNTATIKLNSNVVTEFARSKKSLIKYPRVAMTAATTEGYTASASTTFGDYSPYLAFDHNITDIAATTLWTSADSTYDSNDNYAYSSTASLGGVSGEWLKLELPVKIKPEYVRIFPRTYSPPVGNNQSPEDFVFLASNDDSTWVQLGSVTGWVTNATWGQWSIPSQTSYKYYAMVCTRTIGSTLVGLAEMEIYGVPEYDPEAHGTDVIMRSVPNVPNTDWLEVYYDGQDYTGTPTSITDKSGNNITATANNITIDAEYNSFEFTESPKSNIIADNVSFVSGDEPHSIVLWVRLKNGNTNNLLFDYRVAGGTSTVGAATGLYIVNNNTRLQFFHQGTDKQLDFNFEQHRWYHITGTYAGGGGYTGSKIYIDGVDRGGVQSGSDSVLVLPSTGTITIGDFLYNNTYGLGDGSIANFRLFNRALSVDEIWQLYAYQKEYFDVSPDVVTFKGGRLGIGTSEPRAVLDVRGDTFSQKYNGGRSTFLTWDYLGSRSTSFAQPTSTSGGTVASILDHEFNIPSCYHDLGTTTLKAYVNVDWRGELSNVVWNFLFRLKIYYNDYSSTYTLDSSIAPDNDSRGKGCGVPTVSYHNNNDSTLEAASVTSQFTLPNCQVSKGSKIKVELLGVLTDPGAGTVTLWTGRTVASTNALSYEMAISSFFVALDVV